MEIRIGGAAFLGAVFLWLWGAYLFSRRLPSLVLFLVNCLVGLAGVGGWMFVEDAEGASSVLVVASLAGVTGGLFGAFLAGIDCLRVETWRREPPRPSLRPDAAAIREIVRQVRTASPLADCPFCSTRVCFRSDLSCPNCGKNLVG
jgi:hypothetical protein